jgi:hypothetical protein
MPRPRTAESTETAMNICRFRGHRSGSPTWALVAAQAVAPVHAQAVRDRA